VTRVYAQRQWQWPRDARADGPVILTRETRGPTALRGVTYAQSVDEFIRRRRGAYRTWSTSLAEPASPITREESARIHASVVDYQNYKREFPDYLAVDWSRPRVRSYKPVTYDGASVVFDSSDSGRYNSAWYLTRHARVIAPAPSKYRRAKAPRPILDPARLYQRIPNDEPLYKVLAVPIGHGERARKCAELAGFAGLSPMQGTFTYYENATARLPKKTRLEPCAAGLHACTAGQLARWLEHYCRAHESADAQYIIRVYRASSDRAVWSTGDKCFSRALRLHGAPLRTAQVRRIAYGDPFATDPFGRESRARVAQ